MRHFETEEIPIRVRHPESNGRIERYHRSVREEAFGNADVDNFYQARELLAERVPQRRAAALCSEIPASGGLLPG